jgi:hypothetical protein
MEVLGPEAGGGDSDADGWGGGEVECDGFGSGQVEDFLIAGDCSVCCSGGKSPEEAGGKGERSHFPDGIFDGTTE